MDYISMEKNAIPLAVSTSKAKVRMQGYEAEEKEGAEDSLLKSPHKSASRTSRASARTRSDSWMSVGAKKRTDGTGLLDPPSNQHKARQRAQTERAENVSQVLSKLVRRFLLI